MKRYIKVILHAKPEYDPFELVKLRWNLFELQDSPYQSQSCFLKYFPNSGLWRIWSPTSFDTVDFQIIDFFSFRYL